MLSHDICLKMKNIRYIQRYKTEWLKLITVKSIEYEEIIMAMAMTKIIIATIIMKIIIIIKMIMRIKIGSRIKT